MLDVTICIVSCLECKDVVYESTLLIFITLPLYFSTFIHFSDHMLHWLENMQHFILFLNIINQQPQCLGHPRFLDYDSPNIFPLL